MNDFFKSCYVCACSKPASMFSKDKQKKDGLASICKICNSKKSLEWASKNKEKRKKISTTYRLKNLEKCKQAVINSQKLNPETKKKWVDSNKEKIRKYKRDWYARNPEKNKTIKALNKAKRRGASGKYTHKQILELLYSQKYKCVVCKCNIKNQFQRDHIIPIALNGHNDISNIQLLCPMCNRKKSAKNPVDFMQENGYLL